MKNKSIVYTSGTFDMLHVNHLTMIRYARGLADTLIVGVNTDELVAQYKSNPIIPFEERIELIRALKEPDIVVPQHSLDHREKVSLLNFNTFVVGDDWKGKFDYLKELGVEVFYFPYGSGVSSTKLKKRIAEKYSSIIKKTDRHIPDDFDVKK